MTLRSLLLNFVEWIKPISVDSVQPLYGPVAGGTRVTITGQFRSVFNVTAVYFGRLEGFIDTHRLAFVLLLFSCQYKMTDVLALVDLYGYCMYRSNDQLTIAGHYRACSQS